MFVHAPSRPQALLVIDPIHLRFKQRLCVRIANSMLDRMTATTDQLCKHQSHAVESGNHLLGADH